MLNSKKSRQALFAASIAVAGLGLAPSSARADTDLVFCNKTGSKIYIAVAYVDAASNKWILSAWLPRNPGECSSSGRVKTGLFYYFAEKEGRKTSWPSADSVDKHFCVPATRIKREMANSSCATGERNLGFRGRVTESAKYTFTFS